MIEITDFQRTGVFEDSLQVNELPAWEANGQARVRIASDSEAER
jgi:hypothetical protein